MVHEWTIPPRHRGQPAMHSGRGCPRKRGGPQVVHSQSPRIDPLRGSPITFLSRSLPMKLMESKDIFSLTFFICNFPSPIHPEVSKVVLGMGFAVRV